MLPGFPTRLKTDLMELFKKEVASGKRDKTLKYKVNVVVIPPFAKS